MLGLGCENSSIGELKKLLGNWDPERIAFLECQSVPDELEAGRALLRQLIDHASKDVRCSIPVSELVVGLKCGGSDGLSGTPPIRWWAALPTGWYPWAVRLCWRRCRRCSAPRGCCSAAAADETVQRELPALVADFKDYFVRHGAGGV